ncbi:LacI family DNA-binding transcriptional regulator [Mangrovimonas sp. YM274]|uniref:LacI family DNA-binding transcriptional regulator n=1 Tax=Mangrovimonas sp. YM274 TaxID=3070660 RepID=UPI0027DBEB98|nr:LacI family DNA-binding transcriptional regulator [Mangrovimonas sp. YM274]WMI69075.1 LacI family DNA-binding transcriptional regulator [Mangrovimonas sp. YM274]
MNKKTTIYDIAKKLDITAATVSRALNNNPKISKATRELVLKTAQKMNYEPNKLAVALKSGKSNNVGVIVPRIDRNFFSTVIRGIEEELHPHGYHVIICQTHNDQDLEAKNLEALLNAQVDGIMISASNVALDENHIIHKIIQKNVPLIFFDRKKNIPGVSSVTINDYEAAYNATKHLIDQGCQHIAHIGGDLSIEIYDERFSGYKQALLDNGFEYDENYVELVRSKVEEGKKAAKKLMKLNPQPDGIFSSSDPVILGAIQEMTSQGIKIPEDCAVIGFSNEPFTKFMELPITSVDQSPLEMGKITAQVFLEQVNNTNNVKVEKKVVLSPELMIRKSSLKKG